MATRHGGASRMRYAAVWTTIISTVSILFWAVSLPQPFRAVAQASGTTLQHVKIDADSLKPGLVVYYMEGFWRHVNKMPSPDRFVEKGNRGKPITIIDHHFGQGNIFDSGLSRGVGVQMMGYIHLSKSGEWQFRAKSNDGIEVFIEATLVVSDPGVHSDRFSDPGRVEVDTSGWYPIQLRYFQRKGTATLKLYWKPPGERDFTVIPEKAYGHLSNS